MTLTGHIANGQLVLDNPVSLPDGACVRVEVVPIEEGQRDPSSSGTTLRERLKNFLANPPLDLPPDAATNHDRYLCGDGL